MALDNLISVSFSESDLQTIDKAIQDIQTVLTGKLGEGARGTSEGPMGI